MTKPLHRKRALMHPGEVKMPNSPGYYKGKDFNLVKEELSKIGFDIIVTEEVRDVKKENDKKIGKVINILIDKNPRFSKGDWENEEVEINIIYHSH